MLKVNLQNHKKSYDEWYSFTSIIHLVFDMIYKKYTAVISRIVQSHDTGRKMTSILCTFEMAQTFLYLQCDMKVILKPRSFTVSKTKKCSTILVVIMKHFIDEKLN